MNLEKNNFLITKIQTANLFVLKKPLLKKNIKGSIKTGGRNNSGKITVRHRGCGNKKKYRKINFHRTKQSTGIVCNFEYDPNRNANIAAVYNMYLNSFFYIVAPKNLKLGDIVKSNLFSKPKVGHFLPLAKLPVGSFLHNISIKKNEISKIARSAGSFCQLKEKTLKFATLELNSGKLKKISNKNCATVGIVSNEFAFLTKLTKAGQSR